MAEYSVNHTSLRIVISDPHLKGGGQVRYVENLVAQLLALGHKPAIACKPGSVLAGIATGQGCALFDTFAFRGGLRPSLWRHDLAEMRRVLRAFRPHIVHVNGSQDHWIGALANRTERFPAALVRTRHNTYAVSENLPNRVLNRRWTDFQIVVCETVRRDLAAQRTFDAARMCSIHNGVDAAAYAPNAAHRNASRESFGYRPEHVVCGIVGRLVPAKGHTFLFQAAQDLIARYPDFRILVLGQGEHEQALRAESAARGLSAITHFAGFREDMPQCVNAIDIGVQPSIDCDTSSFSLKELMAAEKPVIASDYGGLTEIVQDGVEGFVVPTGSIEPLTSALIRLVDSSDRRASMGLAGRQRVMRDFTVEVFGTRTAEVYQKVWQSWRDRHAA